MSKKGGVPRARPRTRWRRWYAESKTPGTPAEQLDGGRQLPAHLAVTTASPTTALAAVKDEPDLVKQESRRSRAAAAVLRSRARGPESLAGVPCGRHAAQLFSHSSRRRATP